MANEANSNMTQIGLLYNAEPVEDEKQSTVDVTEEPEQDETIGLEPTEKTAGEERQPSIPISETMAPEELVFVEERLYVVPFRFLVYVPLKRRAKKAVILLREFATRHMKSEYINIHPKVNEQIWARGISKPPRRIRVRMAKDTEGVVHVLPTTS